MKDLNASISYHTYQINIKYTKNFEYIYVVSSNEQYPELLDMQPKRVKRTVINMFIMLCVPVNERRKSVPNVYGKVLPSIRRTGKFELFQPVNDPYKEMNNLLKTTAEN